MARRSETGTPANSSAVDAPTGTVGGVSRPTPREVADILDGLRKDPEVLVELQREQLRRAQDSGEYRIRGHRR